MAYNLKSVKLPKLTGLPLKLFAAALENPVAGALLMPKMMKDAGFLEFRKKIIEDPTTPLPLYYSEKPAVANSARKPVDPVQPQKSSVFATIADFSRAYQNGEASPESVAEKVMEAIETDDRSQKPLRAFLAVDKSDVRAGAEASGKRIRAGRPLSLLDGVPIAIKDEVDMVPYPTTVGTSFMGKYPVTKDSTVVSRLRAAGALLIGKTNMHEIGINPDGLNVHHGIARNPYNPDYDTGGSSSGSAAAVASGLCPAAIGADGGGSIRVPASHCGLVGLKSTFGRVSEHGAAPLCWSVAHLGPLAAGAADAALIYSIIAGPDPEDPHTAHQPAVDLDGLGESSLDGVRLGIFPPWFEHADAAVLNACKRMVDRFRDSGAEIQEVRIPELDEMRLAHAITILSEMSASMNNFREHLKDFGPATRISLRAGRYFSANDYVHAQRMRTRAMMIFGEILEKVDAVLTPSTAVTAPKIPKGGEVCGWSDLSTVTEVMRFVFPGNLTGLPAVSFPVGYDDAGLPVGMQAMGRPWEESLLLRLAGAAEDAWEKKRPERFYRILE